MVKEGRERRGCGGEGKASQEGLIDGPDRAGRSLEQNHSSTGHRPDTAALENP